MGKQYLICLASFDNPSRYGLKFSIGVHLFTRVFVPINLLKFKSFRVHFIVLIIACIIERKKFNNTSSGTHSCSTSCRQCWYKICIALMSPFDPIAGIKSKIFSPTTKMSEGIALKFGYPTRVLFYHCQTFTVTKI